MFPYFALLAIPALFTSYTVSIGRVRNRMLTLTISRSRHGEVLPVFFFLLLLLLMLRHETIGRDLLTYKHIFQEYTAGGLEYVFNTWQEVLFRLYNWVIFQITENYQIYLMVTAVITVLPIAHVYCRDKSHGYLKIAVFVKMSTFIMLFSGLRQSIAMAVGMLAYECARERKKVGFFILALVASLFHHSGFMVFWMYPLYHIKLKKKHLLLIVPAMICVFVFNRQIFGVLSTLFSSISGKYVDSVSSTGAYGSLALFVLFAVFSFVITDQERCDAETLGLRNFLLMTVIIQCFAPLHSLAMRMNYYYILFIPLALGKCLTYPKQSMRQVAKAGEIVISMYFTVLFVYNTYRSSITGISALDTFPYVPFWKGT